MPLLAALALAALALAACSSLSTRDAPMVTVAGVQPLEGEGFEMRLLVKLRVQNPNDATITYNGVALKLAVQGKTFATGVSDAAGTVPRFSESVIEVPVTISAMNMLRQVMGVMEGKPLEKIDYVLTGKLAGSMFNTMRFKSAGTIDMPKIPADSAASAGV
jgi:LEA14-like dessication related protein